MLMYQVMTFKPAISKRAHEMPARSFEELSEGDRLRRDCYMVSVHCAPPVIAPVYVAYCINNSGLFKL